MEWSKAKSTLIVLFAVLNVFLFISILLGGANSRLSSDYKDQVTSLLKSKNIRIEAQIPSYNADTGSIVYKDGDIDEDRVVEFFLGQAAGEDNNEEKVWYEDGKVLEIGNNIIIFKDNSPDNRLNIQDKDALLRELKRVFDGLGIKMRDYVADIWQQQDDRVYIRYIKKYKKQLLLDTHADFIFSEAGMEYVAIVDREVSHTIAASEIMSAWHILPTSKIQSDSTISGIDFGYKRIHEGELYDSPVWRIRFLDGTECFYNAYTGEELVIN